MNLSALTFEEVLTLAEMGDPEAIYIYMMWAYVLLAAVLTGSLVPLSKISRGEK